MSTKTRWEMDLFPFNATQDFALVRCRFTNEMCACSPVEITLQISDTFTDYVQYYTYDANDEPIFNYDLSEDGFTWGEEGFSFYASYPADGEYSVGIIAYDFDNNFVANYATFRHTR